MMSGWQVPSLAGSPRPRPRFHDSSTRTRTTTRTRGSRNGWQGPSLAGSPHFVAFFVRASPFSENKCRKKTIDAGWLSDVTCTVSTRVRSVVHRLRCKNHVRYLSTFADRPSAPRAISGVPVCLCVYARRQAALTRLFRAAPPHIFKLPSAPCAFQGRPRPFLRAIPNSASRLPFRSTARRRHGHSSLSSQLTLSRHT